MRTLYIVPIEPIETRYTKHWYTELPKLFKKNLDKFDVVQIEVGFSDNGNTEGAFFNFADTMEFKSRQAMAIASMFSEGKIKDGDVFFYADYWNPTAHNVRYMADLLDIDVKLVGVCHAGAWDPHDLLGQKFKNKAWAQSLEESLDKVYDVKIFATKFSRRLYEDSYGVNFDNKSTGFPMEYYDDILTPYWQLEHAPEKDNIVVFPHRKSPEKNLGLFKELAKRLPEYEFVIAMDVCKTKEDYHNLLYRSKLAFSASLQETLGISMGIEALRCGCAVLVPNRLSYAEMGFDNMSRYPGYMASTVCAENDEEEVEHIAGRIKMAMDGYNLDTVREEHAKNYTQFFNGALLYTTLNAL
jgi:glycosyltransferase involved in cell wall biosynthesis